MRGDARALGRLDGSAQHVTLVAEVDGERILEELPVEHKQHAGGGGEA